MGFALTNSLQLRPEQQPATKISQHSTRQHELGSKCKGGRGMTVGGACGRGMCSAWKGGAGGGGNEDTLCACVKLSKNK